MSEVILSITAGKGPQKCRRVVAGLTRAFLRDMKRMGLECDILDGMEDVPSSILLRTESAAALATAIWLPH